VSGDWKSYIGSNFCVSAGLAIVKAVKAAQQAHAPDLLLLHFSKLVCWQKHILLGRILPTRKREMRDVGWLRRGFYRLIALSFFS
jgi:hypothetical protein